MKFTHSTVSFTIAISLIAICTFLAGYICRDVKAANEKTQVCTKDKLCPAAMQAIKGLRDYQLSVYNDSTVIFDGDRHVITLSFDSTQSLDNAISADNK